MKISNSLIRSFGACYDPSEVNIPENESLLPSEWIEKYRDVVKDKEDIIWLMCRNEFLTDRKLRLFAVWCAREALKLVENPDERSINACNVAEIYADGNVTELELAAAWAGAWDASRAAARAAALAGARDAALAAAWDASRAAAWDAQIDQLIIILKEAEDGI